MYAVIETGGKQYRVGLGDKLKVEKLALDAGKTMNFDRVLMVANDGDVKVGTPTVNTAVTAKVLSHGRGEKIRVFKMKRRKNYRRTQGHRQDYTELEIVGIGDASAPAKSEPDNKAEATAPVGPESSEVVVDDLTQINGIGPVIAEKLNALGFTTIEQIANLTDEEIPAIDEKLSFKGRIEREEWVQQAKDLLAGSQSKIN